MPRKQTPTLTDAELRIMDHVWQAGEASVNDVLDNLPEDRKLAYNTVLTTMRILERKGYLEHIKRGRAFVYRPLVNRIKARSRALSHMINSFFDSSPEQLMVRLIEDRQLTAEDIERLQKMVDKKD